MLTSGVPSMNCEQTYSQQPSYLKSPAYTTTSDQQSTSSQLEFSLLSTRQQNHLQFQTFSQNSSTETEGQLVEEEEGMWVLDLTINNRNLEIRIESQQFWKVQKELEEGFKQVGIKEKMFRPLKMVVYEQLARKYNSFRALLNRQAQKYGQALLENISQLLALDSFQQL